MIRTSHFFLGVAALCLMSTIGQARDNCGGVIHTRAAVATHSTLADNCGGVIHTRFVGGEEGRVA